MTIKIIDGVVVHRDPVHMKIGNSSISIIPPDPYPTKEEQEKILDNFDKVVLEIMRNQVVDKPVKKGA